MFVVTASCLQERADAAKLTFAHADSKVKNADQVSKLLRVCSRGKATGVWDCLQKMQHHAEHADTWASQWHNLVRILGPAKESLDDFGFMVRWTPSVDRPGTCVLVI